MNINSFFSKLSKNRYYNIFTYFFIFVIASQYSLFERWLGINIIKSFLFVVVNNSAIVLLINLENGRKTNENFLQPKILFYVFSILAVLLLNKLI